jgi:hypothetical protein
MKFTLLACSLLSATAASVKNSPTDAVKAALETEIANRRSLLQSRRLGNNARKLQDEECATAYETLYQNELLSAAAETWLASFEAGIDIDTCEVTETSISCSFPSPGGEDDVTSACTAAGGTPTDVVIDFGCTIDVDGSVVTLEMDFPTLPECLPAGCEGTFSTVQSDLQAELEAGFAEVGETTCATGDDAAPPSGGDSSGSDSSGSDSSGGDSSGSGSETPAASAMTVGHSVAMTLLALVPAAFFWM